jgi:hypothetical protein
MTTYDRLLDDLRAANPVPDPGALELPATVAVRALARPQAARRRLLPAAGVLAVAGAVVVVLLLALGGGGAGTPDLAARAYAAAAGHGVTHWRTDMATFDARGRRRAHQRQEGWARGATTHVVQTEFVHGRPHVQYDMRQVGHRIRSWMSISDTYTTTTVPKRRMTGEDVTFRLGDPMLAFRLAYQQHRLRALGDGRFDVAFRNLAPGSVVYEVDPGSGRPLRLVETNPDGSRSVWSFTTYESLPDTKADRDRLLLLPHPGAGPGNQDPRTWFRALREGPRPSPGWQKALDRMAEYGPHRFGQDPRSARVLTPGVFLVAGRHYVCINARGHVGGSSALARRLGGGYSLGGTCVPIKKAIEDGISTGDPDGVIVAVPDGTTAIEARYRWHGPWRRIPAPDGFARLPGLGYEIRLAG